MDKSTWQSRIRERLASSGALARSMIPGMTYGALSASTLLPLLTAVQQGEWAAIGTLFGIVGSVGGNLIANQIQSWQDRSEAEIAQALTELAETPEWQQAMDTLIRELETPRIVQAILGEAEWDRFGRLLRQELEQLGNLAQYEVYFTEIEIHGGVIVEGNATVHIVNIYQNAPGQAESDAEAFAQALTRYLIWVRNRYGQLNLRGIERRERQVLSLTLDDVYVSLKAAVTPQRQRSRRRTHEQTEDWPSDEGQMRTIDMADLLAQSDRLAIIGGPGSGKTTFLHIIAASLADALLSGNTAAVERHLGLTGDLPLPIFVSLSDYNGYRRRCEEADDPHKGTLTTFITHNLIRQEAALSLPADFFQRLLIEGRSCIVLLDGLDEVADERERSLVRRAVENLEANGGIHHLLVTSRSRAYQDRSVLSGKFQLAEVQPMTLVQAQALADRWCRAVYDETRADDQSAALQKAIAHLEAVREKLGERPLIDSPLMVTMVAIVHYNQRRLPEERAELYDRCVDVLLAESYKPESQAHFDLVDRGGAQKEKRSLLAYLAFCMMSAGEKAGRTVSEAQMAAWLRPEFVRLWGEGEADRRLALFVQALRERGSLLDERDGRYQFIHLTFQEFLAAVHLVDSVRESERIVDLLYAEDRITQFWWRETALLTVGYLGLRSTSAPLDLLQRWVKRRDQKASVALLAAEVATAAFLEQNGHDAVTRTAITDRLVTLLTDPQVTVDGMLRCSSGVVLGRLGDPRRGVGVVDGLPDIDWVQIDAGPFLMGSDKKLNSVASGNELPQFTCGLIRQSYRLARYPITVVQYNCFTAAGGYTERQFWTDDGWDWRMRQRIEGPGIYGELFQKPNHPQVGVSWYEAVAFCNWLSEALGYRVMLPSEAQWERAARHTDGRIYPWGDDFSVKRCNSSDTGIGATSAVGIFAGGMAQCGALDIAGNVWEWCSTQWLDNYVDYEKKADDGLDGHARRVLRGGSFNYNRRVVRCASRGDGDLPVDRDDDVGFRVLSPGL